MVSLGDDNLSSCGAVRVEVSSSGMENKVAFLVCFPALNEGKVTSDRLFEKILLSFELSDFFLLAVNLYAGSLGTVLDWDLSILEPGAYSSG